jgi:hypothetical protein
MHLRLCILLSVASAAACSAQATDSRFGAPRPAREPTCNLEIIDATASSTFAGYDQVGVVRIGNAPAGTDPLDPSLRDMVRPRACALGGEAISVLTSGDARVRSGFRDTAFAAYVVWAKKRAAATPQRF